jgi:hypothetical protein
MRKIIFSVLLLVSVTAWAGMFISAGMGPHTHTDANTGGASLFPGLIQILDVNQTSDLYIISPTGGGLAFSAVTANQGDMMGGAHRTGGATFVADATASAGVRMQGSNLFFYSDTGLTAGNSFTPTQRASINSTALTLSAGVSLASSKACASGYTRMGPNYCALSTSAPPQVVSMTSSGCVQSTALTGVSDAKGVQFQSISYISSTNSTGNRISNGFAYSPTDATCASGVLVQFIAELYEMVAVSPAGTQIQMASQSFVVRTNSNGQTYFNCGIIGGSGAGVTVSVLGYFD